MTDSTIMKNQLQYRSYDVSIVWLINMRILSYQCLFVDSHIYCNVIIELIQLSKIMSLQKHASKPQQGRNEQKQINKARGSYTQSSFYRKPLHSQQSNGVRKWPRQSAFQHKTVQEAGSQMAQLAYSTLNPSNHAVAFGRKLQEQEYQALAVFQLNRQKEKNRILQERLKNKELYIVNLKEINNQLTDAFEKCQAELDYQKRKNVPQVDVRQYLQQINELKHLVIRLEDKINQYQKKENRKFSSLRQESGELGAQKKAVNEFVDGGSLERAVTKQKRSKTVANQHDSSPEFKKIDMIQDYIVKYPNRITNFISQFLSMVEWFSPQAQNAKGQDAINVKKRLKIGWKWIKQTVIEWNKYKSLYDKEKGLKNRLKKVVDGESKADQKRLIELVRELIGQDL